ncbi:MAG TPA: hypothetical protein DCG53_12540 [Syntrophus sp. (in: bacteria)]|jgi:Tfp pilus assembly PilM family ATPase|nr:hypothetical protein [Syntrophus sp. (in: bacteria)]
MMTERILGLDIGDQFINAVAVDRTIRGNTQVVYCASFQRTARGDPSGDIKRFFEQHEVLRQLPCITALPVRDVSFRNLFFPFHDDKKIRQTMAFEVEPLLPYPITEAYLDYVPAKVADKKTILIAAARKDIVRHYIDLLKDHVQETRIIDIEGVPLVPFFLAHHLASAFNIILDIGAKHAVALFISEYHLFQIREYPIEIGLTGASSAGEKRVDGSIADVYGNLCQELGNTIESLKWQGFVEADSSHIYLTGSGALDQEIRHALSRNFSSDIDLIDMTAAEGIVFTEEAKRQWEPLLMNQALALALRPLRKGEGFDFRSQEKRGQTGPKTLKKNIHFLAITAGLILFSLGVDALLGDYEKKMQLKQLKSQISSVFKQYNPDVSRIVDPVSQMRTKITETKKAALGLTDDLTGFSVLDVLKSLSGSIPPALEVLFTTFTIDRDSIIIKGEAKNFDTVEAMKKELSNSRNFKSIAIGSTNLVKQGGKVEFNMQIYLK